MIHVILRGDLGNWLFQYALGRRLARRHGTELRLSLNNRTGWWGPAAPIRRKLERFPIRAELGGRDPLGIALARRWGFGAGWATGATFFPEQGWGFDPAALELPDESYLFGYFQSERYFADEAEQLREELRIRPATDPASQAMDERIAAAESVSIHVRRGDYLRSKLLGGVCTPAYYAGAVAAVRERVAQPRFFVFSDDVPWCRRELSIEGCAYVDLAESHAHPSNDMRLMSRCRHHIIANSTFSWWGAWLNPRADKLVVAPGRWFTDEAMNQRALADTIPTDWLRVACG